MEDEGRRPLLLSAACAPETAPDACGAAECVEPPETAPVTLPTPAPPLLLPRAAMPPETALAKPPKATLDVRREVQRFMCNSMSSFAIILKEDVKAPGSKPKDKPIAKAGESIKFESDDSKELTAWVTDITAVWRAGQQF